MSTEIMHRTSAAKCRLNPGVATSGNHCRVCEPEHFAPADDTSAPPLPTQDGDGREPAPLDPSKVKAGDTVTLEDRRSNTHDDSITPDPDWRLSGKVREIHVTHSHSDGTPYAWSVRIGHTPYQMGTAEWTYTLTDHQPAPKPAPATFGTATVEGIRRPGFTYLAGVAGHEGGGFISFLYPEGDTYFATSQFTDFVPDEARALPTREEVVAAIRTVDLTVGGYLLGRIADAVMALLRGESR